MREHVNDPWVQKAKAEGLRSRAAFKLQQIDARDHLRYIHLSESDRGTPGEGTCDWDEIFATLRAIGFTGGLAMESFINMPPEVGYGLAVWRPVAENFEAVMDKGLPFLRNKAKQYRLI